MLPGTYMGAGMATGGKRLVYRTHSISQADNTDVTIPSGIQSGDLLLFYCAKDAATTSAPPSGWTEIDRGGSTEGPRLYGKISDGTETGTIAAYTDAADRAMVVAFRGGLSSFGSAVDTNCIEFSADMGAFVVNASTLGTKPMLVYAFYSSEASVDPRTYTGDTPDGELGGPELYMKYNFYDTDDTSYDITVDMDDEGSYNCRATGILPVVY